MKEIEPKETPEVSGGISAPVPVGGTPPYVPPGTAPGTNTTLDSEKIVN